jgi:hypothetical protein
VAPDAAPKEPVRNGGNPLRKRERILTPMWMGLVNGQDVLAIVGGIPGRVSQADRPVGSTRRLGCRWRGR